MYVATRSFRDNDGDWIEEGRTYVTRDSDAYRDFPAFFRKATDDWRFGRSAPRSRTAVDVDEITRPSGVAAAVSRSTLGPRPATVTITSTPSARWYLGEPASWEL